MNEKLQYAVVQVHHPLDSSFGEDGLSKVGKKPEKRRDGLHNPNLKYLVVAFDLVEKLQAKWLVKLEVQGTFLGSALEHCRQVI